MDLAWWSSGGHSIIPQMSDLPKQSEVESTNGNGNGKSDSQFFGVSIRGWLATVLILTVCAMSAAKIEVTEPLYTMAALAIGFYFGQKTK